jgi:type I restriction enzyme S subunit
MKNAYPEYKQSKLDWFKEVPHHWSLVKVAWDIPFVTGWTPSTSQASYFDGNNIWVSIRDMKSKTINRSEKKISDDAINDKGMPLVPKGSLLFSFKLSVGKVGFAGIDLYTNEAIAAFMPNIKVSLKFLYYAAPIFLPKYGQHNIYGSLLLNRERIEKARTYVPPVHEQLIITNYLDYEVGRIDELISEKQNFIKLLKEKRQALISHVVTKGLDPDVEMKDSGVEWIGEIPRNWSVGKLKYFLNAIGDVDHYMPDSVDDGIPYVMTGDLTELVSDISFESCKKVSEKDYFKLSKKIKTSKGDVVMARYATIGTLSYVDIDKKFLVSYSCVTIKPDHAHLSGLYLFYYLKSHTFLHSIQSHINTNTQGNVGVNDLKKVEICVPSSQEQERIVNFLHEKTLSIDAIIKETERSIDLLKEHRTALISAAVTGKIDLRDKEVA